MNRKPRARDERAAEAEGRLAGTSSVQWKWILNSERTVVSPQRPRDLDARAVSLEAVLGGRNVQSCDGYPAGPAPIMVEVFSGKDER
jgi:hypothetical protein